MILLRSKDNRGHFNHGWLDTYHSFSFANYYDPRFMGFSSLRVINEDRVAPSKGFGTHSHSDMEILTYVLNGTIAHNDSMGNKEYVPSGEFQIMSAGSGVTHSEFNASNTSNLHFYQIWITPNKFGIKPRYEQKSFSDSKKTLILSPNAENGSLKVYQDMKLWRYRNFNNESFSLSNNRKAYIQVISGELEISSKHTNPFNISTSDGAMVSDENIFNIKRISDKDEVEILIFDLP